ncbi:MAG: hypothetical protein ACHQ1H_04235 [Nitrososphaerales archaeon]
MMTSSETASNIKQLNVLRFDHWIVNGTVSQMGGLTSLQVNGAVTETAEFFAALVRSASPNGQCNTVMVLLQELSMLDNPKRFA